MFHGWSIGDSGGPSANWLCVSMGGGALRRGTRARASEDLGPLGDSVRGLGKPCPLPICGVGGGLAAGSPTCSRSARAPPRRLRIELRRLETLSLALLSPVGKGRGGPSLAELTKRGAAAWKGAPCRRLSATSCWVCCLPRVWRSWCRAIRASVQNPCSTKCIEAGSAPMGRVQSTEAAFSRGSDASGSRSRSRVNAEGGLKSSPKWLCPGVGGT